MGTKPRGIKWLRVTLAVLAGLGGVYFLFNRLVDNQLRPLVERELTKVLQAPVSIQTVRGGLTGDVILNHVSADLPGHPWTTQLRIDQVAVNLRLFDLLFKKKDLESCFQSLALIRPNVTLVRLEPESSAAQPVSQTQVPSNPSAPFKIPSSMKPAPKVFVKQGAFFIQAGKKPQGLLTQVNFEASSVDGTGWSLVFQAHPADPLSQGELNFNGSLHLDTLKISGRASLDQWPLTETGAVMKDLAGWQLTAGTLTAESPIVFQPGRGLWFDAKTDIHDASVVAPGPIGVVFSHVNGRAFVRPTEINVPGEVVLNVGETKWTASGMLPFDNRALSVQTRTDNLYLSSLLRDILKLKNLNSDGNGRASLMVAGSFQHPLIAGEAELGLSHVANLQMDSLTVRGTYSEGQLDLQEVAGKLYKGQFTAQGNMRLSGQEDAPISFQADLTGLDAKQLAAAFGIQSMEGQGEAQVRISGTVMNPTYSITNSMDLTRTLRNTAFQYSMKNNIEFNQGGLSVVSTINGKAKLTSHFTEKADSWQMDQLELLVTKKGVTKKMSLSGGGSWPKGMDQPIDIKFSGKNISLQDLPVFNDQFPDVSGSIKLDGFLSGTRKDLVAGLSFSSDKLGLGKLPPKPMTGELTWNDGKLDFKRLEVGDILNVSGYLNFSGPDAPQDLKVQAQGVEIGDVAALSGWNNPPQPFLGWFTGRIHCTGVRDNPVVEGDGLVTSLKVGDWWADEVEGLLNLDQGKLQIRKLKILQGKNSLLATGSWDSRSNPGVMELRFAAKDFQLGKGPFLNGDFDWKAKTGDPWWKNWEGTFSSDAIGIGDPKKKFYHFNDFFMNASCKDSVLHGKLRMGKTLSGSAVLDFSQPAAQVQADLKIEPVLLSEMPELAQFLPPTAKVSGTVSGQVKLEKGTFDSLPLSGDILVADGKIEKYNFDKLELKFSGDKKKISPSLVLEKDKARYSLEGTLESPSAIWDPGCKIDLNGPVHGEKLLNILSLLNVSTENHRVGGDVEGNLAISGTWTGPEVAFSMTGENLRFDNNIVPTAELHFSMGGGKISLDKNRVTLAKGRIDIDKGTVILDPNDPGLYSIDLSGTTQNLPIAGIFNMSSQIRLAGKLSLEPKDDRPTFEGQLSFLESGTDPKKSTPFVLAARIDKKVIKLTPLDNDQPQLVGQLDLSQDRKIIFNNIQLLHSTGTFSVDGTLDLDGQSHLTSDAGKIPIEEVGKWFFSDFPVSGTGNYHVIFDGNLNDPILTASFSVANGKVGDLNFDLLDGNLKSRDNTLYLGNKSTPLEISRRGVYSFQVYGKTPFALSAPGLVKVRNEEMDINATMDKGDFSLILLAGLAKKASGSMDFNAHVGGTMDDPVLTMDLDLKECQMVPSMVAQSIEDISGRIKVRDNKLVIQDLNGRIGQGRVFITSPPIDQTKMVLENFIPKYIDVQVITVGDHGLWLNVPCIMRKGEWGEIYFYGQTPDVPLRIEGPMSEPKVIGTALLDSGHYTFPAIAAVDEHGQAIDYKELAGVRFDLTLRSGKNCWYSNEFNTNYLELKVDPGAEIKIEGRDADKTPEEAGIKSHGESLGSKQGWLRYLGHEFKLEEASLYIPIGALPTMRGRATDKLKDVQIVTTAGIRTTDMDIWVDFKGTFGNIGFTLDSNPRFSTTDKEIQQNMLLSYIMFGRDMTGYSKTVLEQKYQDLGGVATQAAEDALNRVASNYVNTSLRPVLQAFGGVELDVKSNAASYLLGGNNSGVTTGPGYNQIVPENTGNTLAAAAPIFQLQLSKYLNQNLSIQTNVGLNHNLVTDQAGIQGQLGLKYDFTKDLSVNAMTGERDDGQQETKAEIAFHTSLPDIKGAKPGDTTRPRIMRFDVWVLGFDKVQIVWETDKITKAKVRILDADGNEAKTKDETDDYTYDHQMAVDGLKPESDYRIQLVARDPNGNEVVDERKVSTATE